MTERLARASSRRPWLVIGLWLIVILAAFVLVAMFLAFEGEAEITRTTESKQADRILDEGFPQEAANGQAITEVVIVRADDGDVRSATAPRTAGVSGAAPKRTNTADFSGQKTVHALPRDTTTPSGRLSRCRQRGQLRACPRSPSEPRRAAQLSEIA